MAERTKPLVLVSKPLALEEADPALRALKRQARVVTRALTSRQPLSKHPELQRATGVVAMVDDKIDRAFFKKAPNLKVIANHAVGVNNIDLEAALARGVVVCNTPDVLTNATAELAVGLLFAAARRFKESTELLRKGAFKGWHPRLLLGTELAGARLGIIGRGRIGSAVADKARALGMTVAHVGSQSTKAELKQLLATSDFVSIHCPLTARTRNLLGHRELGWMKPGSFLVNTARGEIVDEQALLKALSRNLRGAAIDVFWNEPKLRAAFKSHPAIFVLPHIGSATTQARGGMARLAVSAITEVLSGRHPANRVI